MRYIIIGAGAVGGTIGGRLFQAGHDVVLVARGAHLEALDNTGLRLLTPDSDDLLPVPASGGPVPPRAGDVLIVATKSQDTLSALEAWPRDLPVVCAQNGVANEDMVLRRFSQVYGMCVWLPATHLDPGVVAAYGTPHSGLLPVGRYPQGVDDLAHQIAADLTKSGFVAPAVPDVMRYKYGKLLSNLGNAVEALVGHADGMSDLAKQATAEGEAVLAAAGIAHPTRQEEQDLRGNQVDLRPIEGLARGGGSSWQSLARGAGSIEADYLNGEIVLLARRTGVGAPVNEVLQREANRFARDRHAPGSMPVDELRRLIGERSAT
ncbi:ketopantoate reductase family protein [Nonomuraea soli]|uniref:2-dehydropantoate 2-reductase n=1 Tax=Nonomuraea soli TaxID=1032476 RepID=A0A7W0HQ30_9ACTN|nr:ketopantoate reductase family protein [Nonomuraea soli]MBA2891490.1 2-dehydropantoate 2-reductase [Nonomuraea soli]